MNKFEREERRAQRQEARDARKRTRAKKFAAVVSRIVPPGMNWESEVQWIRWGLICAVVFGMMVFLIRCTNAVSGLYEYRWVVTGDGNQYQSTGLVLKEGALMPPVSSILAGTRVGFALVGLILVILTVYHYRYYTQGSKSIYVMKRLPSRWELHRRSLTLPSIAIGIGLILMVVVAVMQFGLYLLMTPKGCLPEGQWSDLWMWMIGGGL